VSRPASLLEALDVLLRFGAIMLRSGESTFRVRDDMHRLAPRLGIDELALLVTVTSMTATARRGHAHETVVHHVGPLGINAWRIGALERLAYDTSPLDPAALQRQLDAIEATGPLHGAATVALAVGATSSAFAWLNGGNLAELLSAFAAGALGQGLRLLLLRRHLNQYAVTALCAIVAGTLYVGAAALLARLGLAPGQGIGVIAAGLFLIPGFPLVAALLDLLQHQTAAGLTRLAYGTILVLAAAFGLGIVVFAMGFAVPSTPSAPTTSLTLLLRAVASLAGGCGFAVLYNSSWRVVLTVGVLTLAGNELRLALQDAGVQQPAATLAGVLLIGLLASLAQLRLREPRIALTVPSIIIMVPGASAFHSVVLFAHGDALGGLQAAVVVGFVVGAMAIGLALARFASERKWLFEA
jgi:uncharacterized membrane protein YjjP (DUF1212 family)